MIQKDLIKTQLLSYLKFTSNSMSKMYGVVLCKCKLKKSNFITPFVT
jgi:hypothetical protein